MKKLLLTLFISVLLINIQTPANAQEAKKDVTLEGVMKAYSFYPKSVYGLRSMNDGIHYTTLEGRGTKINKYSYKTGDFIETILNTLKLDTTKIKRASEYQFSDDETKILLYTNRERIYRRSFTADYYVYDRKTNKLTGLSDNGKQQLATFSPDGKKIAFVRKNNIFIKNLIDNTETQITFDGKFNFIINGAPDWVYEEEFEFNKAFAWSPDSKKLAFMRFDESKVKMFNMTKFQGSHPTIKKNALYPENYAFKYPKAGESNSIVSVHVYNSDTKKITTMDVGKETDQYIPRIKWTNSSDNLCIFRLNRLQNKLELLFANPNTGVSNVIYTDENKYYIDEVNFDYLTFLKDNKHFVILNEKDGWNHIYLYDMQGNMIRKLTKGNWDVSNFIGFDEKKKTFYFIASAESPLQREVYSVKINGKKIKKLSTMAGTNSAVFSKNYKYYINYFSNINTPTYVTIHNSNGKLIRVLEDNKNLKERLKNYKCAKKEFFKFKTSEGVELNGWILKPADFDPAKKYPVLMTQYSGPNSQEVKDSWDFGYNQVLASKGYIVACVDGRGTGARGEEFRKMTYLQLGKYETIDQIEAAKYLRSLPYIDSTRIGIWGWSYGGFMTCLCMEKGNGIFKAGIAVAPVTNWRYYDNIYTERFMRTPQENPDGYDDNSPLFFADKLQGKLLICHGTADDNVHLQNTLEFSEKLVQANKQFEMQIYTNRNHSIYGGNTRFHLFTRMLNFITNNL